MVEQGCPERASGEPTTMQAFKAYGKLLKTDKRVVLVFYESSTHPTLSKGAALLWPKSDCAERTALKGNRFLNDLNKFDSTICVINHETKDNIPGKFFTPSQAIQDLVQWLRDI
ncbi:MAG: hypothetical protein KME57_17325 [Scytonema hyalinum WJT4-NPBG1]|jgi:hypothetical protein|nr:hypothetical protein [Scytonema hyalinum WJT4-NPBG1]